MLHYDLVWGYLILFMSLGHGLTQGLSTFILQAPASRHHTFKALHGNPRRTAFNMLVFCLSDVTREESLVLRIMTDAPGQQNHPDGYGCLMTAVA